MDVAMTDTARVFRTGRSQAVRLPKSCRFECDTVSIRRDPATGDVVLSARPANWDALFALDATTTVPADYMTEADRRPGARPASSAVCRSPRSTG
jgi:antitoxin VapB